MMYRPTTARVDLLWNDLMRHVQDSLAERQRWRLHLSLHSAIQATRERIMPIARVRSLPSICSAADCSAARRRTMSSRNPDVGRCTGGVFAS